MRLLLFLIFSFNDLALAQGLKGDFSCKGESKAGEKFEIYINDIEFSQEVILKQGLSSRYFSIDWASYSEKTVSPQMVINIKDKKDCKRSKSFKPLKDGFVKISPNEPDALALVLVGNDSLTCTINALNFKKISGYINSKYK